MNEAYLKSTRTSAGDEVFTPRCAVEPVIKYLKAKGYKTILCPFDNIHSQYVRVLTDAGFKVIHSHIDMSTEKRSYDFFDVIDTIEILKDSIDCIVSNPPFSLKTEILSTLYAINIPFMMLLPQTALQSKERVKMFMAYGLEYLGFDSRIGYYTKGEMDSFKTQNHFASGYFCRNVLPEKLIFEELLIENEAYDGKGRQSTIFDFIK